MKQCYEIVLDSQLGQRRGTLTIEKCGGQVDGILSLLGFDNPVTGRQEGEKLCLQHELQTLLSRFLCRSELEIHGNKLGGTVFLDRVHMKIYGRKSSETEPSVL